MMTMIVSCSMLHLGKYIVNSHVVSPNILDTTSN